jgi:hypothetical protein
MICSFGITISQPELFFDLPIFLCTNRLICSSGISLNLTYLPPDSTIYWSLSMSVFTVSGIWCVSLIPAEHLSKTRLTVVGVVLILPDNYYLPHYTWKSDA